MNKVTDLFLKLVTIDSPSGEEYQMGKFLRQWLDSRGFIIKSDRLGNILAFNAKKGEPILLCAHMDTVNPGKGIKPVVKKGIIRSSGNTILGADNKAAIACILSAIDLYIQSTKNSKPIELLFTVKEETGGGVEYFPFNWIQSKKGYVFDSARPIGGLILRSPYICNFTVTFYGKAAHSSEPDKGKNALLAAVKSLNKIPIGKIDNSQTTVNVGLLSGGEGINIIPSEIRLSGEIRSYGLKLFNKHLNYIKRVFKAESVKLGVKIKFVKEGFCPGYVYDQSDLIIKETKEILKKLSITPKYYYYSGVSDANLLIAAGIKVVNLTDGVALPHTTKESVKIAELEKLTTIILRCLKNNQ